MILRRHLLAFVLFLGLTSLRVAAGEWPTYQGNYARNAFTPDAVLGDQGLSLAWSWSSPQLPQPAWPQPAKWDSYKYIRGLKSMRNYDPVFHVTSGGGLVFFGSSVDDSVHALDLRTGTPRWSFVTEGPVRVAPTLESGRLFFGSDDGYAYCLEALTGQLIWKFSPQPGARRVLNGGKLISLWPIRTGIVVDQGTAYFAASMLPWKTSYLCAVDATSGSTNGIGRYVREMENQSIEGPFAASAKHLVMPQGRVPPRVYARSNGEDKGALGGGGGSFVLLADENQILHGPGNLTGRMVASQVASRTQLASFDQANAIVVVGNLAYVITDTTLSAMDRSTREPRWTVDCGYSFALIVAGQTLFVGGTDGVAGYQTRDGRKIWSQAVQGRAYGLAAPDGHLLVSTDAGNIYAFQPQALAVPARVQGTAPSGETNRFWSALPAWNERAAETQRPGGNDQDWIFHRAALHSGEEQNPLWPLRDGRIREAGPARSDARITGIAEIQRVGEVFALKLDGKQNAVLVDPKAAPSIASSEKFTVDAWVQFDRLAGEIGLVSALGGNAEKLPEGWRLGVRENKLVFGLACARTNTWLEIVADRACEPQRWHQVAAIYDGAQLRVYLDGELAGSREALGGEIRYPVQVRYEIGRRRVDGKDVFMAGMLHRVRIQGQALTGEVLRERFRMERTLLYPSARLASGPSLQFTSPTEAVVRWTTLAPSPTVLEYDLNGHGFHYEDPAAKTGHEVRLTGLRYDRIYAYSVATKEADARRFTREFECDTYFNYSPSTVGRRNESNREKSGAVRLTDLDRRLDGQRGIALVLGLEDGRFLLQLCEDTECRIIGFDTDLSRIQKLRGRLSAAGLYGVRVVLHHVSSLAELPVPGHFANVILTESMRNEPRLPAPPLEILRLLKPGTGSALLGVESASASSTSPAVEKELQQAGVAFERLPAPHGNWVRITRDELVGAGDWTHQYGGADNSAFGGEALLGARSVDELEVQWLGEPGPRYQDDRNGRNAAPLAVKGRLFCQGLERVICVDAHNGTVLWSVETPELMRYNVPRDCANWCADQDSLYLAIRGQCWRIDQETGRVDARFPVPAGPHSDWNYDWGFLAREGDRLIGTGVREGTAATDFWGGIGWYDAPGGAQAAKVCSDHLFSCDPRSGSVHWTHSKGLILNSTITTSKGRVYFLENRQPDLLTGTNRWIHSPQLWEELRLVVLDAQTGGILQERPVQIVSGDAVVYMAEGQGKLVLVSSHQETSSYYVYVRDSASGELLWQTEFKWMNGDHGGHMSRPAIVGNRLFIRPRVFDLHSGEEIAGLKMSGGGCGTYAASANALFFRSGNVSMWETDQSQQTSWSRLRPDCWISTLPALGMVLSPEGGGGCSCGSWMETSAAFLPDRQQTQLLRALASTGESTRVKALLKVVGHPDPTIRLAAIRALGAGRYQDGAWEATPALLRLAAEGPEADRTAARAVLRLLDSPRVNPLLLSSVDQGDLPLRVEAMQTLGDRGASQAMPQLLQLAGDADPHLRSAALRAIPQAALARHYPAILGLMKSTDSPEGRKEVAQAVRLVSRRLPDASHRSQPLVDALAVEKDPTIRREWISLLGSFGSAEGLRAVQAACRDSDANLREAAWSALGAWPNPEAFEPLLELAASTSEDPLRQRALGAAVRVLFTPTPRPLAPDLLKAHERALTLASTPEQRRPVLEGLGRVGTLEALRVVEPFLQMPDNRRDAAVAVLELAKPVGENHREAAVSSLLRLRQTVTDSELTGRAGEALDQLERFEDFVKSWQVAGPFPRPSGSDDPLLAIAFEPERSPPAQVVWNSWNSETLAKGPTLLNFGPRYGATNACIYARVRVKVPAAVQAVLQVASDESYKVWLNEAMIQEKVLEKPRRATSKPDRLPILLREGWNSLLLKSVQTEGDWQLGCRLRNADGTRIENLVWEP